MIIFIEHIYHSKIYTAMLFAYFTATFFITLSSQRYGSYQQAQDDPGIIVFRAPLTRRVGMAMCIPLLLPGLFPSDGNSHNVYAAIHTWITTIGAWVGVSLLLFFVTGPDELRVDVSRRTYQRVIGFTRFVRSGNLDGAEVRVVRTQSERHWVVLTKSSDNTVGFSLGTCGSREKALALAESIAADLHLPTASSRSSQRLRVILGQAKPPAGQCRKPQPPGA